MAKLAVKIGFLVFMALSVGGVDGWGVGRIMVAESFAVRKMRNAAALWNAAVLCRFGTLDRQIESGPGTEREKPLSGPAGPR
jgi:hypothetical protein